MKKVLIILLFLFTKLHADDFKLEKIINGLERPWSLSFIDNKNILVTEKPGKIKMENAYYLTMAEIILSVLIIHIIDGIIEALNKE